MPELSTINQCRFLAVYTLVTLLCAVRMSSSATAAFSGTRTVRYVCTTCENSGQQAFFASKRAVHMHIVKRKACHGSQIKKYVL